MVNLRKAEQTRALCILLVLQGVVSFRATPRVLGTVNSMHSSFCHWIPHFTSVINWVLRLGLGLLRAVVPIPHPWIAIMDTSIDIGTKKALVVLRIRQDVLALKGAAVQLADCECIGVHILEQTNGETISHSLTSIFNQAGNPIAILKDQGTDLAKGVTIWQGMQEKEDAKIEIIDDIGHMLANGLKAEFDGSREFQAFLKAIRKGAARLRQTALAFLTPPKLRTKGRFQGIGKLAEWGGRMLILFDQQDKAKKDPVLKAAHKALPRFLQHRAFIQLFLKTIRVTHCVLKLLKQEGLNQITYEKCMAQAALLPETSAVKKVLLNWLDRHYAVHARLNNPYPLLVSTDIIESLFGKFKRIIERSPTADINRMALIIPVLCGNKMNHQNIRELLSTTRHQDIKDWEKSNITYTQRKNRREFFEQTQRKMVQETG